MDSAQYLEILAERRLLLEQRLMSLQEAIRENDLREYYLAVDLLAMLASGLQNGETSTTAVRREIEVLCDINQNQRFELEMEYQHVEAQLTQIAEQYREFVANMANSGEPN